MKQQLTFYPAQANELLVALGQFLDESTKRTVAGWLATDVLHRFMYSLQFALGSKLRQASKPDEAIVLDASLPELLAMYWHIANQDAGNDLGQALGEVYRALFPFAHLVDGGHSWAPPVAAVNASVAPVMSRAA